MFKRKKNKDLESLNYLETTPVHNYGGVEEETGLVSVLIPRFTNKILVKFLTPRLKNPFVKAKLDEFGSEVWRQINGKNKVQEIADNLSAKFGEKIQPVNERLTKFLTMMYQYSFITFNELNKRS